MAPATGVRIPIWIGNDEWFQFVCKDENGDPFDLTGSILILRVTLTNGQVIRRRTDVAGTGFSITNAAGGIARNDFTFADTRAMPAGEHKFEVERWIGVYQESLIYGLLVATLGVNDDANP